MTLVKVNPRNRRKTVWGSPFDQFFSELFHPTSTEVKCNEKKTHRLAANVVETADHFRIDLAVPGFDKKDIDIKVEKEFLHIEAKKEVAESTENSKFIRREFGFKDFSRSFQLPETINNDDIKANFKNGVLSLTLTKKEEAKEQPPRTIKIK